MALVRYHGKCDLFITFTANGAWPEIVRELLPGQTYSSRPDLTARVFKMKLDELIKDIWERHVLGRVLGRVHTVEWQKRGLPHAHLLVILAEPIGPDDYDRIVHAELPDEATHPVLHALVSKHMMHGPCGALTSQTRPSVGKMGPVPSSFQNPSSMKQALRATGATSSIGDATPVSMWS